MKASKQTAIYAGTFDPITKGHMDLIERASKMFDGLIIAIGVNAKKTPMFTQLERVDMVAQSTKHLGNVTVATFDGLLVDYAVKMGVSVIVRGLRTCSDFEYEFQMVKTNRCLNPKVETVFLTPKAETEFISSSVVREIWKHRKNVDGFVPKNVASEMNVLK